MKRLFSALIILTLVTALGFAGPKVAMIIAQGGLGDKSYNDSAYAGLTKAAVDFDVTVKAIESKDVVTEGEKLLRNAARAGFDLVITLEYSHFEVLERVAKDFPNTTFAILNIAVPGDNVVSVIFKEHEGSFLVGALAAMVTSNTSIPNVNPEKIIGVIGGTKSAGIDKFLVGYKEGAHYMGADIVYQVAGGTGLGVIQAAKDMGRYAIGVDSDQDSLAPGNVLCSMMKRVDIAIYDLIKKLVEGTLKGGETLYYGLKEGGIQVSPMVFTRHVIPREYIARMDEIMEKIICGEIVVTDITMEQ